MSEVGFFGKIPAKGDFVRHNVADEAARAFEQYIQESNDALRGQDGTMPENAIRTVFTKAGSDKTVIAVLVPSEDKVGRKYPLVIFTLTNAAQTPAQFSTLPVAWAPFLEGASRLGERAQEMEVDQLKASVGALPIPSVGEVTAAEEMCRRALQHPLGDELHARLFGGGKPDAHLYAYQTFLTACQDAAKDDPSKAATVLDCPVRVDVDLFVWLELTKRVFGFPKSHPSYFWVEDPAPRLLLSLGSSPLAMLQFLSDPSIDNQRLWPLTTEREKAIEAAKSSLGPALAGLNGESPMGMWLDKLQERSAG